MTVVIGQSNYFGFGFTITQMKFDLLRNLFASSSDYLLRALIGSYDCL